jgi:hypothetical protein
MRGRTQLKQRNPLFEATPEENPRPRATIDGTERVLPRSGPATARRPGVTGGGSGDTVPLDRRNAMVRAHPVNPDAVGQVYVLVYERIS